uniref:Secreted protein n=1 Tax=Meloidogyne hapla TaxID=6305 RepID=A0A1I8AZ47_MELHA
MDGQVVELHVLLIAFGGFLLTTVHCSSAGGTGRPRRVSLAGAVDADELRKCISEGAGTKPKVLDPPGSGEDDDEDDALLTEEQTSIAPLELLEKQLFML